MSEKHTEKTARELIAFSRHAASIKYYTKYLNNCKY